ncbi:MAG TPA: SRPBCC family protein, partial [Chloroflexota bacterium]|nr:SRPBCC family protein [Chloroflexota bacterium]
MAQINVETGRDIDAPPAHVFACLADFAQHRPHWLPPNYTEIAVEQGGVGDGTIVHYRLKVGPRQRIYHMRI